MCPSRPTGSTTAGASSGEPTPPPRPGRSRRERSTGPVAGQRVPVVHAPVPDLPVAELLHGHVGRPALMVLQDGAQQLGPILGLPGRLLVAAGGVLVTPVAHPAGHALAQLDPLLEE